MLPLLVIPPIQPFHPRRIGLGFLSFPSSNSLISFPSCQLPPLWAHKETQAPYFQSLAASFPKNMGGIRSLLSVHFRFRVSNFALQCKFIRINTYERLSKQMTSTPPESHSYKKHGGR